MKYKSRLLSEERDWFNHRYATVESEGQFLVIRLEDHTIYKTQEFRKTHSDKARILSEKLPPLKLADEWLSDPDRVHYPQGFTFDPSEAEQGEAFNLWRGYAIEAIEGDIKPYLEFVLNVICSGDQNLFNWVMGWQANIIQEPNKKPGTALVLRGGQGIGKSFFASCIGCILGENAYIELNDPEQVVGRFGGHLKGKLLICADEGAFTIERAAAKLKNLITAEKIPLEEKYRNTITVDNYMRLIITGNDEQIIRASRDERRYCVINVSESHKENFDWDIMHAWRNRNGLSALHYYLQHYQLKNIDLRVVPKTAALTEQKIHSMDDIERWLLGVFTRGNISRELTWGVPVQVSIVRQSFVEFHGLRDMGEFDGRIGKKLYEIFPDLKKSRNRKGVRQEYCYHFPPLEECREKFGQYVGGAIDWPTSNE